MVGRAECRCLRLPIGLILGDGWLDPVVHASAPAWSVKNGQARPRHPDCQLKIRLAKTLSQPWFIPFASSPKPTTPLSFVQHRRGLQSVLRRDRHDRPDIWFVKDDGSNLDEVIADLWHVTESIGLPVLDRLHDPCAVIEMVLDRTLVSDPTSMAATDILDAARRTCSATE